MRVQTVYYWITIKNKEIESQRNEKSALQNVVKRLEQEKEKCYLELAQVQSKVKVLQSEKSAEEKCLAQEQRFQYQIEKDDKAKQAEIISLKGIISANQVKHSSSIAAMEVKHKSLAKHMKEVAEQARKNAVDSHKRELSKKDYEIKQLLSENGSLEDGKRKLEQVW